ncbi:MAG TPA: DMT family transporter [Steroidobacteraceae bacterium]|nr:DMT family transporter [Steroidobacteraceae bacterium]
MNTILYLTALLAGLGLAVQVGLNSTMRQFTGNAAFAAVVSFCVGLAGLLLFLLATRTEIPSRSALASAPWWAWLGGLFGAFYVAIATIVGPRLGASTLLALTLVGQIATALVLDHFGWIGFPHNPISMTRVAGAALLVCGVLLISRSA